LPAGTVVGDVATSWGERVAVVTTRPVTVFGLAGGEARITMKATQATLPRTLAARTAVATVTVSADGKVQTVTAVTAGPITSPSMRWRLERR
jgi:hypothetical protein